MEGTWSERVVGGHACDVYDPPRPNSHGCVALYLHGVHLTRLVNNAAFCAQFDRHGLPVVAPMTRRSWWTDKICTEFDPAVSAEQYVIDRVMPWINELYGAPPGRVGLLGTSMGGQAALRYSFKRPDLFPVCAAISPAIDFHQRYYDEGEETIPLMYPDPEAARQDTAILHVHPFKWPRHIWFCCDPADERWFTSSDKLHMKLASMGIPHECDLATSRGGHGWEYYDHMAGKAVEFIAARLERERLRLV